MKYLLFFEGGGVVDVKYYTPYIEAGQWLMRIPTHQRDASNSVRMLLPEGVHIIKILWEGPVRYFLRYYEGIGATGYRELLPDSVNPAKTTTIMRELVVPPGGGEIVLWCAKTPSAEEAAPPNKLHAGVTVFLGTNETPE